MFKEGVPYLAVEMFFLIVAAGFWMRVRRLEVMIAGVVVLFFLVLTIFFFRDPERTIPEGEKRILSPADGKVVCVADTDAYPDVVKRVCIYLSLWDVHVNRIPVTGRAGFVKHLPGKFHAAFREKSSKWNEHTEISIETEQGVIYVRQIAGLLARRIVCHIRECESVRQGERFGMIRFGSRVELYVPANVNLSISEGERVRAGITTIGIFQS